MGSFDALRRENEALRDRISRLNEAILRINGSLDLSTVLREAVDSACVLTGARCGVITTIGEGGKPRDLVSSGFTPDEHRQLTGWPDGPRFFEHLRDLSETVQLPDLPAYVRSLGLSAHLLPAKTAQGTPMRHRGEHVGNFFLGDKQGGREFTTEDEEILVLFASQAAAAIANARTHQNEQRARANLETLIETSPVGVVVLDARTAIPVSFNQEARRIMNTMRSPGQSREALLQSITCRFPDGREITLDEFHLAQQLRETTTVRAQEIVLSVPTGRSVRMLVNATPIRSADGCGRIGGRHHAGPDAAERAGAVANRVPGHGEPRAARPADLHQGLGRHAAAPLAGAGPGRAARVPPDHRRSGRPHDRPDQRPAGCGTYRDGHAVGRARRRRRWLVWWTGRGTRSSAAAAGTRSTSTCRRTCPA